MTSPNTIEEKIELRAKPRVLSGFRDFLPESMLLRQQIISSFRTAFERHGYEPVDTPVLEHLDILTGKAGENEKLMYQFADHGGRDVGMRYDLTVPLARMVAMHQSDIVFPFKRYHIAPVWRAERSQRGRFREFWQCDADIVGSPSPIADAEGIAVLVEALSAVGLPQFTVRVNHRKLLEATALIAGVEPERSATVFRAIDKLDKVGEDGVRQLLIESGIEEQAAGRVVALITTQGEPQLLIAELRASLGDVPGAQEALDSLSEVFAALPSLGVSPDRCVLDLALARGLDYYTGPVVEVSVQSPPVGSLAGGGRYDNLIGSFLGRAVPATGVSLGLERIIEVVREFALLPIRKTVAEVIVVAFRGDVQTAAELAAILRTQGINADLSLLGDRSVGDQFKYADRRGIPFAVVAGPDELAQGVAGIKNLATGDQANHAITDLGTTLTAMLAANRRTT